MDAEIHDMKFDPYAVSITPRQEPTFGDPAGLRTITVKVREFGNSTTRMGSNDSPLTHAERRKLRDNMERSLAGIIENCKTIYMDEPDFLIGPNVDKLRRFRPIGWYRRLASPEMDFWERYFAPKGPQGPDTLWGCWLHALHILTLRVDARWGWLLKSRKQREWEQDRYDLGYDDDDY